MAPSQNSRIDLIIGPSSSGKSSLIEAMFNDGRLPPGTDVVLAHLLTEQILADARDSGSHLVIHYNSFLAFENSSAHLDRQVQTEPILDMLLKTDTEVAATLLVASASTLVKRAAARGITEPKFRTNSGSYPNEQILDLLNVIDLSKHFAEVVAMLDANNIPIRVLDTNLDPVEIEDSPAAIERALSKSRAEYTSAEVDEVLEKYHFEYHSIELSHDRRTPGAVRTGKLFADIDLEGKSLLDIGCGYGSACYLAESAGATRVVGTELKPHRYIGGIVVKNVRDSDVSIRAENLFDRAVSSQEQQRYDVVLLLNVIHHLPEPFNALNTICELAKETIIIEFPTLDDPKFRSTLPDSAEIDSALPLVGISTIEQDQTFVFNPSALERFMAERHPDFSVQMRPSEIATSRLIMIATRAS